MVKLFIFSAVLISFLMMSSNSISYSTAFLPKKYFWLSVLSASLTIIGITLLFWSSEIIDFVIQCRNKGF